MQRRYCEKCDTLLIIGDNITQNLVNCHKFVCRNCANEQHQEYRHRTGKNEPMNINKECAAFLGVYIAEEMLSHVFKHVERMPYGNPGYDFKCSKGYLVDAKCSCRRHSKIRADQWSFAIRKNCIADYFLCLAFDNREDLNPEHVWLIPGGTVNHLTGLRISETRVDKWTQYEQHIDKVMACCNILKATP